MINGKVRTKKKSFAKNNNSVSPNQMFTQENLQVIDSKLFFAKRALQLHLDLGNKKVKGGFNETSTVSIEIQCIGKRRLTLRGSN